MSRHAGTPLTPAAPHRHSVLVVDDYKDTRDTMIALFVSRAHDAVGAASGPEALALFRAGLRPCVIILDVRMPEMDGWETWEIMRVMPGGDTTSVVLFSADDLDAARARTVGIRECIRKPAGGSVLLATIDRHCRASAP
jgi:CheY-like chemotaxis protein